MKVGIIADGQAEAEALSYLINRVVAPSVVLLKPLYADMQPFAPLAQIVRSSESRIQFLNGRGADRHIVLLDREGNVTCPGSYATMLEAEYKRRGFANVAVVMKNRTFENWLVGDLTSVARRHRSRVDVPAGVVDRIQKSGADNVNAIGVLNGCIKSGYCKRRDAIQICQTVNPEAVMTRSRSFRRFVKVYRG